jgi:hypothetical protein
MWRILLDTNWNVGTASSSTQRSGSLVFELICQLEFTLGARGVVRFAAAWLTEPRRLPQLCQPGTVTQGPGRRTPLRRLPLSKARWQAQAGSLSRRLAARGPQVPATGSRLPLAAGYWQREGRQTPVGCTSPSSFATSDQHGRHRGTSLQCGAAAGPRVAASESSLHSAGPSRWGCRNARLPGRLMPRLAVRLHMAWRSHAVRDEGVSGKTNFQGGRFARFSHALHESAWAHRLRHDGPPRSRCHA